MTTPVQAPISPAQLLALCCYEEANLEPDDGVAAVARVVLNRVAQRYASDGTIAGTVLAPDQFSWTSFDFVGGKYRRVAWTSAQVEARAEALWARAEHWPKALTRAERIASEVQRGAYEPEDAASFAKLSPHALLYDNLALASPPWATPEAFLVKIGHHSFFRA